MTPERLAEIRERATKDYQAHQSGIYLSNELVADRLHLLAEIDRLTSPPTHDERQMGLSDGHSESYRLGWRAGQAQARASQGDA